MGKFNSQICTTREQSERLLALGLKKETADMVHMFLNEFDGYCTMEHDWGRKLYGEHHVPAWSLHRLMEMLDPYEYNNWIGYEVKMDYDNMIDCIEFLICDDRFNDDYWENRHGVEL